MGFLRFTKVHCCALVGAVALTAAAPNATTGSVGIDTSRLQKAVTVKGVRQHQLAFQLIANRHNGTRASGTSGYDASAAYVARKLRAVGYQVTIQAFDFALFEELSEPNFAQVTPNPVEYPLDLTNGFLTMEYSGNGDVTAPVQAVDVVLPPAPTPTSTSGCEATDFAGFTAGNVALIQRGTCTFAEKAANAEAAGAAAVVMFNEGQPGRTDTLNGTLGGPGFGIPIIGASFAIGNELAGLSGATVRVRVDASIEVLSTSNVIAETPRGRADRVVVVGAHLDSVLEGPGINDNGSGSGMILEIAEEFARHVRFPRNKVRFAWWGAEESGLIGATEYVAGLSQAELDRIALNLNFDMVGSPNFVRFIYDGDGDPTGTAGPAGSDVIEAVFKQHFDSKRLPTEPTAFDGRSDYGPFIDVGIPAGGLFTGAEDEKTPAQAAIYGGTAGVALDPCYHQACDRYSNNNRRVLDQMSDAAAHAVMTFALQQLPARPAAAAAEAQRSTSSGMDYRGPHLVK